MPTETRQRKFYQSKNQKLAHYIKNLSGLVVYYPLGEGFGNSVRNKAPNTYNQLNGTVSSATIGNTSRTGNFALFSSAADVVTIAHNQLLEPGNTGKFTCAYFYRPDDLDGNVLPRHWEKGANYMCHMGDSGNGKYKQVAIEIWNGSATTEIWGNTDLIEGNWYFIVGQFDESVGDASGKIWINGRAETISIITSWSGTIDEDDTKSLLIGNRAASSRPAVGGISHFQLYDRILSEAEVLRLSSIANARY